MDETHWLSEGFVLDDAGNLIGTSYVDLRDDADRQPIGHLIKFCKREHALEDSETILISPVARFRDEGENLIRDAQEGLAHNETRTIKPLTPEQAFAERRSSDLSEANDLLGSSFSLRTRVRHENVERSSGSLAYGREWWICSTSIAPENDAERAALRATLDPAYDHESLIGQPAKFAEALGRMVAEQLGPQSKDGWMRGSVGGVEGEKTYRPTQWVLHGPVVYSDQLFDTLTPHSDEAAWIAALLFTKSASHAAMREYRFAVLRDGTVDDKVLLKISGMMRDALERTDHGLVRPVPQTLHDKGGTDTDSSPATSPRVVNYRESTTKTNVHKNETRSEIIGPDGQVLASDTASRESVEESTETKDLKPEATHTAIAPEAADIHRDPPTPCGEPRPVGPTASPRTEPPDHEVAKQLAFEDANTVDEAQPIEDHGQHFMKSFEQSLTRMIEDPAAPIGPVSEKWAESALGAEDMRTIHRLGAALVLKVTRVPLNNRRDASSACWHAMQCIRNLVARIGTIVETVSIARERFVVIQLRGSPDADPSGRIVVTPSGGYVYWLRGRDGEQWGHGTSEYGTVWFPMDRDVATFERAGWKAKEQL